MITLQIIIVPIFFLVGTFVIFHSTTGAVLYLLLSMFSVALFQAANIPLAVPKFFMESILIILALKTLYVRIVFYDGRIKSFGFLPLLALSLIGVFSALYHYNADGASIALFVRDILRFYLLVFVFYNLDVNRTQLAFLGSALVAMLAIQLPVAWVKAATFGIREFWIGTVHLNAGELSLILACLGTVYLFAAFLYLRQLRYLVLLPLVISFAIIGEKRATVFLVPVLILLILWIYQYDSAISVGHSAAAAIARVLRPRFVLSAALLIVTVVYMGARLIPSLNPEEKVWGPFEPRHLLVYSLWYNLQDVKPAGASTGVERYDSLRQGRLAIIVLSVAQLSREPLSVKLFGNGGGFLTTSPLATKGRDVLFERYGLRGKMSTGLMVAYETGAAGLLCVVWLFGGMLRRLMAALRKAQSKNEKILALGTIGAWAVFSFDFFLYSQITWSHGLFPLIFALLFTVVVTRRADDFLDFSLVFGRRATATTAGIN